MASRIAIVLGAGKNIGASTVDAFKHAGYKVAYASRSAAKTEDESTMAVACDLLQPSAVNALFDTVRKTWGEPSVVVYNGTCAGQRTLRSSSSMRTKKVGMQHQFRD